MHSYQTDLRDGQPAVAEEIAHSSFRPYSLSQSVGLIDRECVERRCSEAEMLHYILAAEFTRQELERSTKELKQSMQQSAKAVGEAQSVARGKSDLLATMSHEIRTPLNGIIGMAAILLSRDLAAPERDCVETIRTSGEALLAVLDDLLNFSKMEAGRLQLESVDFEPAQLVHQSVQILRGAAASKQLSFRINVEPAMPAVVRGDLTKLRQVLLNLLGNAIKFTETGTIELKAEVVSSDHSQHQLRFSITDEGIGIAEEHLQKVFQPFVQADASTSRKYGGTGLGLAISKQIIELMGGNIGVRSRPGVGSTFSFTVKMRRASHTLPSAPKPLAAEQFNPDIRILLVEDNPINQKVALLMLENLGYKADVAQDGFEAVHSLRRDYYDLILMDCRMPEMDGFEATRQIRATPGYGARVPIIAMTAGAFSQDRQACLSAGMTDYLSKPIREAVLRDKLRQWLSGPGLQMSASAPAAV